MGRGVSVLSLLANKQGLRLHQTGHHHNIVISVGFQLHFGTAVSDLEAFYGEVRFNRAVKTDLG